MDNNTWTITKLLDWTTEYFKKYAIEWPHLEAEILLAHVLKFKRIELYTNHEKLVTPAELGKFKAMIQRRSQHEPIAYITNNQPFMSLDFYVDRNVLIPRPETELLVEQVVSCSSERNRGASCQLLVDLGTGSGCIAISLAKFLPTVKVIGTDSSPEALAIAQKNAETHNVTERCEFRQGDLFEPIQEKIDLIVSNPPYIPSKEIDGLMTDVKDWEPRTALDGGPDGLDYIRKIIAEAPNHLSPNGTLFMEIGFDQGERVKKLAEEAGKYVEVKIIKDLNGKDRILKAHL
jgi:release factor glutamine methyltransferase